MLVQIDGGAGMAARTLAGETDHTGLVLQKLTEYYKNLLKPLRYFEDVEVAVTDALKRQRNMPTQYHGAIEQLVRMGHQDMPPEV